MKYRNTHNICLVGRASRPLRNAAVLILTLILTTTTTNAQEVERRKVALFTPLYLDSAFGSTNLINNTKTFPRFLEPGLEFYQGAQLALDSFEKRGGPLEVFVFDTRAKNRTIQQMLESRDLADVEMIIAHSNLTETKTIAQFAKTRKIPFISATLPNDAGEIENPYLVVLNSTLPAHVEGIYKLLQKHYSLDNIIMFRKPGAQEDQVKRYFTDVAKTTVSVPVKIKYVDLPANFTASQLIANMDSTRNNIIIGGSLEEAFATKLAQTLNGVVKDYPTTLIGMPTWENINFGKSAGNVEIVYSTPFHYSKLSPLESRIGDQYNARTSSRPGDMFYRGYETMLRFGLLLLDTREDVASNLTRKGNYVFTQFDIQPVFKNRSTMTLDYFENKNVYFIRVVGGVKNFFRPM